MVLESRGCMAMQMVEAAWVEAAITVCVMAGAGHEAPSDPGPCPVTCPVPAQRWGLRRALRACCGERFSHILPQRPCPPALSSWPMHHPQAPGGQLRFSAEELEVLHGALAPETPAAVAAAMPAAPAPASPPKPATAPGVAYAAASGSRPAAGPPSPKPAPAGSSEPSTVTSRNVQVGLRVVRGLGWTWGDEVRRMGKHEGREHRVACARA